MSKQTPSGSGKLIAIVLVFAASCGDNIKPSTSDTGVLLITPMSGLETTEAGGTATFQVALTSRPFHDVNVSVSSSNAAEGIVAVTSLKFTGENWNQPVTVTVTGVNDNIDDGDQVFTVKLDAGADGEGDVAVANRDNDDVGVTATPTTGLQTSELGTTATFTIVLTSQPLGSVTIPLTSSRPGEGTVDPTSVTFTPANWSAAQTVTVTGVDDFIQDDNQAYNIVLGAATSSTDAKYNGFDAGNVAVINVDNDIANFLVSPTTGLQTTESQGFTSFSVRLVTQPSANVTIDVESDTPGEGVASVTTLTFTPLNWNAPQDVTVTGVNDNIQDGAVAYKIVLDGVVTTDTLYLARDPQDVSLTNLDNDSAGATVTMVTAPTTTESGGTATFSVVLLSEPVAPVTFSVASGTSTEGVTATTSLTFTALNWNAPQFVTVVGQDDFVADGDVLYAIVLGADASYTDIDGDPVDPADVSLTNRDNDTAGILVSDFEGLETSEDLTSASFTIVLLSQPTANVTISYVSSKPLTEGTVGPSTSLVFTPGDWNVPKSITLTGVDDLIRDGDQLYTVTLTATSTDLNYDQRPLPVIQAKNLDNETIGIRVTPLRLDVSELGDSDTFEIVLVTQPTSNVTIPLESSDTTEGTINKSSVTFTMANWNVPQIVTVSGQNDALIDGQQQFFVRTLPVTAGSDPFYVGADADDVLVFNFDDESPGVYVQGHNLLKTLEGSNQPQFIRMRLTIAPLFPVTCTVESSDTTEVTITPSVFTFDATNFSTSQTITVRGVDDPDLDGDQLVTIITNPCTSQDPVYNLFDPRNIRVLNRDNE